MGESQSKEEVVGRWHPAEPVFDEARPRFKLSCEEWYSFFASWNMATPQEFIENWPLYTRASIRNFAAPKSITRMCARCTKETTWSLSYDGQLIWNTSPQIVIRSAGYMCALCGASTLLVLYRLLEFKDTQVSGTPGRTVLAHHAVQKVGQIPPPSIEIPADLSTRLGNTTTYYKNALICRSQNYGVASVAYMRRVVEEKTDELIDVVVDLARTYGVDPKTIESLANSKKQVQYEEKLRVASEVIPDSLRPGGVNPLGQLYTHLSVGVHDKTDDECILIFDDLRADFEYVFRNLYIQAKDSKEFAERMQNRAGKKP